ncbi:MULTISPECIES: L-threonylcarbamoyladenylate synthase [Clostridium]|uniref:L-threonylcarbamoyladenylate synthase n=1 Tax=Clostridium TaxID=1485 RepID=UPI000174E35B|nr:MULTISPECIES: L-threonylcarbamoyladenylate synthase [Clostridium]ACD52529.1 Sua5/YciO/YrdC/YwlC family protein [Clostridium botulinum E3 str. Alaska E43]AJF28530.1 tRNA threonylcarbamoyladenosine biosynthesis protein [Clostridium botulinum]AJF31591.1 tRNA threonylcarbamoyladenosine biosynthesis protein [Clostridium botulinum]KIL08748.1 tRNA threonylcarbamoyladenosine biosynthesis protein [Clostridium botulinum]MBN1034344.1 threonylcarbamoyl-AMP synthase [Clostridium botulinum]
MSTNIIKINNIIDDEEKIKEAAKVIKDGGIVAFPTETVYGLGSDALNEDAVKKIFIAKGRPQDNPLIVHVASKNIQSLVEDIPDIAQKLIDKYWPGPLTLILKKKSIIPNITSADLDTIGIRMPNNEIALKLIEMSNTVIAAPSANISGRPSPTDVERCIEDLSGKVDCIVGGDKSNIGLESTILDCTVNPPLVLRPGGITLEMLKDIDNRIEIDGAIMKKSTDDLKPKAPGMKYRHYAPKAKVKIISGERKKTIEKMKEMVDYYIDNNKKVCILTIEENEKEYNKGIKVVLGSRENLLMVAQNLFESLRKCDDLGADIILAEAYEEKGVGIAIMNRLNKAAGFDIIEV